MEYREYNFKLPKEQAGKFEQLARQQGIDPEQLALRIAEQYIEGQAPPKALAQQVYYMLQQEGGLLLEYRAEDGAVIIRSPLRHQHRPALRMVVTFPAESPDVGQIRLSLRDNAIESLRRFRRFADSWMQIEQYNQNDEGGAMVVEEGRISRHIHWPAGMPEEQIASYISAYMRAFSLSAQNFMENGDLHAIERLYNELLGRLAF